MGEPGKEVSPVGFVRPVFVMEQGLSSLGLGFPVDLHTKRIGCDPGPGAVVVGKQKTSISAHPINRISHLVQPRKDFNPVGGLA